MPMETTAEYSRFRSMGKKDIEGKERKGKDKKGKEKGKRKGKERNIIKGQDKKENRIREEGTPDRQGRHNSRGNQRNSYKPTPNTLEFILFVNFFAAFYV